MSVVANSGFKIVTPHDEEGKSLLFKTRTECIDGVLPISKGGTGLPELSGSKIIASSSSGSSFEEIEVPVRCLSGLRENIQDRLDSIKSYYITIDSTASTWSDNMIDGVQNGYYKTIAVNGIKESDEPIVCLKTISNDRDGIEQEQYAASCIDIVTTGDDSIIVYCLEELPSVNVLLKLICIG